MMLPYIFRRIVLVYKLLKLLMTCFNMQKQDKQDNGLHVELYICKLHIHRIWIRIKCRCFYVFCDLSVLSVKQFIIIHGLPKMFGVPFILNTLTVM